MVRPASTSDDATPNPNSIAAQNLVRLAALTGDAKWREQADRLFGPEHERFAAVALKLPFVSRIVLRAPSAGALPANHPAQTKIAVGSGSAAFVCVGETCSLPVTDPDKISEVVVAMRPTMAA